MTTKGTRLVKPRLAHIAGVDHPAHQKEGWLVVKSLDGKQPQTSTEGLKMKLTEISKALEAPLTKDNAAEVLKSLQVGVGYLISKAAKEEEETAKEKADGVYEATDTNETHDDTDVTKTKAEDAEMTLEEKAKAYDEMVSKKKAEDVEPDADADDVEKKKSIEKALSTNSEFVALKKQLNDYKAKELFTAVETEVKKAAGAHQTNLDGFIKAVINAGGTQTADGQAIIKSLKATAEQIAVGGNFLKEIGANGAPISSDLKSANAQLKAVAKALVDSEGMTMVNALSEAAKRNPELSNILSGGAQ